MTRWTPNRKEALILCVRAGEFTVAGLQQIHGITAEEFIQWCAAYDSKGRAGLKTSSSIGRKREAA